MNDIIETLRGFASRLQVATGALTEDDLRRAEAPGKWSIASVLAHLGDVELLYAMRIRSALAGDAHWPSIDQEKWIANVHGREPVAELVENFRLVRRMNADLLERAATLPPDVIQLAHRLVAHSEKHFLQIQRIRTSIGREGAVAA
jgi:hypothetical protein